MSPASAQTEDRTGRVKRMRASPAVDGNPEVRLPAAPASRSISPLWTGLQEHRLELQ
jgi:hypothetical protein